MSNETVKKVFGIASKIFSWIIIAITVIMMVFTIFSTLTFGRNDRNLFGIRFYIVLSDSMSLSENNKTDKVHFDAGDIVLSKMVDDPTSLEVGDIISFISQNSDNFGKTVTHKIRTVRHDSEGRVIGYETYGTNTGKSDAVLVEPEYVLGVYVGKLSLIGHFFAFLKTVPGYIVCILIPFLLLILWQGISTVKIFKQYKREQVADIEAERAQIAKEREESAQMMRELLALKEQLAKKEAENASAEQTVEKSTEEPSSENKDNSQTNID